MTEQRIKPYGSWKSSITAKWVSSGGVGLSEIKVSEVGIFWLETRPEEEGRSVLMMSPPSGRIEELSPKDFNVRSRVHEYGGGAYAVSGSQVVFSNYADQRLYVMRVGAGEPSPLTATPPHQAGWRYADMLISPDQTYLVCIRETHLDSREVLNELVRINLDGEGEPLLLHSGRDFYASPKFNPDGSQLAWLAWDHPNMPWDGTELWIANLENHSELVSLELVAGGKRESIFQPEWSPEGVLHFVSDRSNWWNLYRVGDSNNEPIVEMKAEFGSPQWVFGLSQYAFLEESQIAAILREGGFERLAHLDLVSGTLTPILEDLRAFSPPSLRFDPWRRRLLCIAGSPDRPPAICSYHLEAAELEIVRLARSRLPDASYISSPVAIEYKSGQNAEAHALYYPPKNDDFQAPENQRPPLIVIIHGGPTSQARVHFRPDIQFWTSRGFGLVDVNYRGSVGYGREFREQLNGEWGIADVEDCLYAAHHLAAQGLVDPEALIIRGGSAGGFTTLSALVFHKVFRTGASYYGVADLEIFALETHKFESRYLDKLIGPYPEQAERYRTRSPVHSLHNLTSPLILFHGEEDRVVPPSQAALLVEALERNSQTFAYLSFPGEAHGFRKAETIERALKAELFFYCRVLGIEPSEPLPEIPIQNL